MNRKTDKQVKLTGMSKLGRVLYYTKAARFWHDGDGASFILNWWNPLSWLFILICFPIVVLMVGMSETVRSLSDLGITYSRYWKNREKNYF